MDFWGMYADLLIKEGLTLTDVAKAIGKSRQYFDTQSRRKSSPTLNNAIKFLDVLGYDIYIAKHNQHDLAPDEILLSNKDKKQQETRQNIINQKLERIEKEQEELQKELDNLLNSKE